jgi:SAM-dependent methyltransferase
VRFAVGDAENLAFPDDCFDSVINVESSHLYPDVDRFLAEVRRVLRPGGRLLLADMRSAQEIAALASQIVDAGFVIEEEEDLTANVVRALALLTPELDARTAGPIGRRIRRELSGAEGTNAFRDLSNGEIAYHRYVARNI